MGSSGAPTRIPRPFGKLGLDSTTTASTPFSSTAAASTNGGGSRCGTSWGDAARWRDDRSEARAESSPSRCKDRVAHGASISRRTLEPPCSKPASRSKSEARMGHPTFLAKQHSARARPTAASRTSPPWSEAEGFVRLRLTCLHGRGSSRRAASAHPRERLDRRGMCRGVRGNRAATSR